MKTFTRATMAFLLTASCCCFSGCGGGEQPAPSTPSEATVSTPTETGASGSTAPETMEKTDGSGSK